MLVSALAVVLPLASVGWRGSVGDEVSITEPEDGTYYADIPTTLDVVIDVVNDSALVIQEIGLQVDSVDQDMVCDNTLTCTFTIELSEGMHELRGVAVRNIGGPLFSQFVQVQVGGDPPPGIDTFGDPAAGDSGTTSDGTAGDTAAGTAGAAGNDTGDSGSAASGGGCACDLGRPRAGWAWLPWLFALGLRRRR